MDEINLFGVICCFLVDVLSDVVSLITKVSFCHSSWVILLNQTNSLELFFLFSNTFFDQLNDINDESCALHGLHCSI